MKKYYPLHILYTVYLNINNNIFIIFLYGVALVMTFSNFVSYSLL